MGKKSCLCSKCNKHKRGKKSCRSKKCMKKCNDINLINSKVDNLCGKNIFIKLDDKDKMKIDPCKKDCRKCKISNKNCCPEVKPENIFDVIVVGSGAAGMFSALYAQRNGANVCVLESEQILGGTTAVSGATTWIPNSFRMREKYQIEGNPLPDYLPRRDLVLEGGVPGVDFIPSTIADPDQKLYAMRYMCKTSMADYYDKTRAYNGLPVHIYKLIERMYDDGDQIIQETTNSYGENGNPANYIFDWSVNNYSLAPGTPWGNQFGDGTFLEQDYSDVLEGTAPGRQLQWYDSNTNSQIGGFEFVTRVADYLKSNGDNKVLTRKRVVDIIGHNVLLVHDTETDTLEYYKACNGIVFACGGYIRNETLKKDLLLGRTFGTCSGPGSKGDFVKIALEKGIRLHNIEEAWFHEMDYETLSTVYWFLWYNSSVVLNKYGVRVYNEGAKYNERGRVHFYWDAGKLEYPNQFLILVYDGQTLAQEGTGSFPLNDNIKGETLDELYDALEQKLPVGYLTDKASWVSHAATTISNYNSYCANGVDPEFGREKSLSSKHWYGFGKLASGVFNKDAWMRSNTPGVAPNNPGEYFGGANADFALQPIQPNQPDDGQYQKGYFAFILAPTAIDSHGGPLQNVDCRAVGTKGIYAAGNAGAGPVGAAYWGAGGTIGWCVVSGAIAGKAAALNNMCNENDLYGKALHIDSPVSGSETKNPVKVLFTYDGSKACPAVDNDAVKRVFYKLDGDLNEYVHRCHNIIGQQGWVEVDCDDKLDGIKICYDQTGWHNVCIQLADENGISLGAQFANTIELRIQENFLIKVDSYSRVVRFPPPPKVFPYHFELANLPGSRLVSIDIKTTDIIRFFFNDSEHNLVHTSTNDVSPPPIKYVDTTEDPDIIPSTNTNRRGFAFDWKPSYTSEGNVDKYVVECNKHLAEPDNNLVINVTSIKDDCLEDPVTDIDHTIYVGPFFFSAEGNPQTDPEVPNLNAIKGTAFVEEGDKIRYIFNDNTHTAKHVGDNTLTDPGGDLAMPQFNFIPTNNGDFFDWDAVRQGGDEITQMFVVCQPHRNIFGQGHRSELIVLPPAGPKPYDVLIAVGSVPYSNPAPGQYIPDFNGTKYPYFQIVDPGSFTQKLPTTPTVGFPSTEYEVSVGQTVRWIFIEEGHNVIEVESDGTPIGAPAFESPISTNNVDKYDWIPTNADIGDHYYMCNVAHGAGYADHAIHKLTVVA